MTKTFKWTEGTLCVKVSEIVGTDTDALLSDVNTHAFLIEEMVTHDFKKAGISGISALWHPRVFIGQGKIEVYVAGFIQKDEVTSIYAVADDLIAIGYKMGIVVLRPD